MEQAQREVCHETRKRTEQARKWAERRFSSAASNTGGRVVEKNPGKAAGA